MTQTWGCNSGYFCLTCFQFDQFRIKISHNCRSRTKHTLCAVFCSRQSETISDYLPPRTPSAFNTHVPVTLANPHPPLTTHPPIHPPALHTWMHTGMREAWHNPSNAKTWPAWSELCSPAALMNSHSGPDTKLGLDFFLCSRVRGHRKHWQK